MQWSPSATLPLYPLAIIRFSLASTAPTINLVHVLRKATNLACAKKILIPVYSFQLHVPTFLLLWGLDIIFKRFDILFTIPVSLTFVFIRLIQSIFLTIRNTRLGFWMSDFI